MPVKLQHMLLEEYSSTKSSFHTNVLQIVSQISIANRLPKTLNLFTFSTDFHPSQFTPLPLTSYLPSSFLHFQPQFPPSLPPSPCLSPSRRQRAYLSPHIGVRGRESSFLSKPHIIYQKDALTASNTPRIYRGVLATYTAHKT